MDECRVLQNEKEIARVRRADGFFTRLLGLMLQKGLKSGEGLLLCPCRQVHTFFMNFSIDLLFLSEEGEILFTMESVRPGQISPWVKKGHYVVELWAGAIFEKNIVKTSKLTFL